MIIGVDEKPLPMLHWDRDCCWEAFFCCCCCWRLTLGGRSTTTQPCGDLMGWGVEPAAVGGPVCWMRPQPAIASCELPGEVRPGAGTKEQLLLACEEEGVAEPEEDDEATLEDGTAAVAAAGMPAPFAPPPIVES